MKKTVFISLITITIFLVSCKGSIVVTPAGNLNSISTRNIDGSKKYEPLKTYAGVSSSEIEEAISRSKKGRIKARNPIYKEIMKYKGKTINEAVDNVVKSQVGGEYLMNSRIFLVQMAKKGYSLTKGSTNTVKYEYVCAGDVWGLKGGEQNIKGFKVNDQVVFVYTRELRRLVKRKNFKEGVLKKQYKGNVITLMGADATIKLENGTLIDIPYTNLRKLNAD
jgi:hypothetical protein